MWLLYWDYPILSWVAIIHILLFCFLWEILEVAIYLWLDNIRPFGPCQLTHIILSFICLSSFRCIIAHSVQFFFNMMFIYTILVSYLVETMEYGKNYRKKMCIKLKGEKRMFQWKTANLLCVMRFVMETSTKDNKAFIQKLMGFISNLFKWESKWKKMY